MAARCRKYERPLPLDGPGQGVVGRRVAGVQRKYDVGLVLDDRCRDVTAYEAELVAGVEPGRQLAVALSGLLLDVDADDSGRETSNRRQPAIGREREVGVTAPEVDHTQRRVRRRLAHASGLDGAVQRSRQDPAE